MWGGQEDRQLLDQLGPAELEWASEVPLAVDVVHAGHVSRQRGVRRHHVEDLTFCQRTRLDMYHTIALVRRGRLLGAPGNMSCLFGGYENRCPAIVDVQPRVAFEREDDAWQTSSDGSLKAPGDGIRALRAPVEEELAGFEASLVACIRRSRARRKLDLPQIESVQLNGTRVKQCCRMGGGWRVVGFHQFGQWCGDPRRVAHHTFVPREPVASDVVVAGESHHLQQRVGVIMDRDLHGAVHFHEHVFQEVDGCARRPTIGVVGLSGY